jgi:HPt (histidine-containing phosphotransfer) domain-containing protein
LSPRRPPKPSKADLEVLDPDGRFRARLEADRQAIAELGDRHDLDEVRRIVHRLAGAAGTFGYREVGEIAIGLDDRFIAEEPVGAPDIARLLAALEQALGKPEKSG